MVGYKVLVANRGEIAVRVLRSAQELGWGTVAIYTENDISHAGFADESIKLDNVSRYMDPKFLAEIAYRTRCTHVHPGYGFLSESYDFSTLLAEPSPDEETRRPLPPIIFIGPPVEALRIASDKMLSRDLATALGVPVAPGTRVQTTEDVLKFAHSLGSSKTHISPSGYPVIIKALDGGGGRGIRIAHREEDVSDAFKRCLGESPSRQLFVEAALVGPGWKHIEVQIVGDGTGNVAHLWERECSVQRRFQKIVEMAPSSLSRPAVQPLLDASLKMASHLKYRGLGTFEFLVNTMFLNWVFMEINPRLQVEHTITEEITSVDLVRTQLLLSLPAATLQDILPSHASLAPSPNGHAIQLRLTAEDPTRSFQLSTGTLHSSEISWPAGHGVRVDTWLSSGPLDFNQEDVTWQIGTDFDSLIAKIIVRDQSLQLASRKALRALREVRFPSAVKTNLELLAGVISHEDWLHEAIDTLWLERQASEVLELGKAALSRGGSSVAINNKSFQGAGNDNHSASGVASAASGSVLLQPGTTFNLTLSSVNPTDTNSTSAPQKHTLTLVSVAHNAFPDELSGTLQTSLSAEPLAFALTRSSTLMTSSNFESPNPRHPGHVPTPLTGKIVELHPALLRTDPELSYVKQGDVLAVISVMKMESVISAPMSGMVERLGRGVEVGAIIPEGMLLCVLKVGDDSQDTSPVQSRL